MPLTEKELGRRIRSARESCGLTHEQLGEPTGLGRVAIEQIEAGTRSVSSIELDRIACAVGRDMKEFFAESFAEQNALADLTDRELPGSACMHEIPCAVTG